MGGTGSKQEDQIVTVAIEQKTGAKFTYVPYKGGGAGGTCSSSATTSTSAVNNPIEAVAHWRAGTLRPLCVFDAKIMLDYHDEIDGGHGVAGHSDLQVARASTSNITMLRGYFMTAPGVRPDAVDYYVDLLKKVRETPEWKKLHGRTAPSTRAS